MRMRLRQFLPLLLALVFGLPASAHSAEFFVAWTDNAPDEDGFLVERRDATSGYRQIASLEANTAAYLDATVLPGRGYCYRVRAFNRAGPSPYTNELCGLAVATTERSLTVTVNQPTYRQSETMVATLHATSGVVPSPVDVYVVLQSGGGITSLQIDGRLVPGLVPLVRNIAVPDGEVSFGFPMAATPPGAYTWITGVASPGTLSLMAPLSSTPFTVVP